MRTMYDRRSNSFNVVNAYLFNARYLPLASIIANAMKRDKSRLANGLARLLYAITDSSCEPREHARLAQFVDGAESDESYVDAIWNITEFELLATTQSLDAIRHGAKAIAELDRDTPAIRRMVESELMAAIEELAAIDYAAASTDLDLSEEAVRQAAHRLRKRYRDLLRAEVAQTVDDPADVEDELRGLFESLAD